MNKFEIYNKWFKPRELIDDFEFISTQDASYMNVPAVFDIETTSFYKGNIKQACMYAWTFGLNGKSIRGRTWDEFITFCKKLQQYYKLDYENRLIVYVHNLSYEFGFISKQFNWVEMFALDNRQPVKALTDLGIEFRCSYILSGYNLATLGKNLTKYKVKKMVGDLDYDLLRHSETPLTDTEWGYILNDGLVVMAFIQEEIERLGSIADLPLTKTGYVRSLCRTNTLKGQDRKQYSKLMKSLLLTPKTYLLMKQGFMGGFTHANHNYVGKVCKNVSSFDFTSSYPSVLCSEMFPMSEPKLVDTEYMEEYTFEKYLKCYCCLFTIHFHNLRSIVDFEHYISSSKCTQLEGYYTDNGRVVNAMDLTITITDVDFNIIKQMYCWDYFEIDNLYISNRGYLPRDFVMTILELYQAKTTLKGVEGKEAEYQVAKGQLNALYGMAVTDVCRPTIIFDENGWSMEDCNIEEAISENNKNCGRFIFYEWGIFCTAYARANLFSGILEFRDDYIYADTDSLKVFNIDKHRKYIDNYNKNITKKIKDCLRFLKLDENLACPYTINGEPKPLGVWDEEPSIKRFITLGAKRYMYEDMKDKMHITISGVSKAIGLEYLRYKYKTNDEIFKNFNDKLIFPAVYLDEKTKEYKKGCGKMIHTYLEYEMQGDMIDYLGNKGHYHELTGVHLEPTSYELSLEYYFKLYLQGITELKG